MELSARLKTLAAVLLLLIPASANAQIDLTIEGRTFTNSAETWLGVNIPRSEPTNLVFKNNTITSSNIYGYMLLAGDEVPNSWNNNLDGALITGNKFVWTGTDMSSITHALFTGHNRNVTIKYNYLDQTPMSIIRKSSNNMSNTGGGIAYNIIKGGAVGVNIKGMSNVNIFNNTFYTNRRTSQTWRPHVHIYTNRDDGGYSVSHGTKIYNNIFYTVYETFSITVADRESLTGLECDYNIYWCETGSPRFLVNDTIRSFEQWQAMGFDTHSRVLNPNFKNLTNFVPASRLDYGIDLGPEWKDGLAAGARWGTTDPLLAEQDENWQAGAVIYGEPGENGNFDISIFPSPARDYISIANLDLSSGSLMIRIYDLAGKIRFEKLLNHGDDEQIRINLESGMFIFQILSGNSSRFVKKFIVIR
jgi:hypothetical protein